MASRKQRYEMQTKIGQGGMGAVYKVYDRLTRQTVALKQVLVAPSDLDIAPTEEADIDPQLSLTLEFRTLAGLRHPHIVSVIDYGFDVEKSPYFVMEYIQDAQTVADYAASQDDHTKGRVLIEILQALDYLHHRGVLHRDLKPDNVLITHQGKVKVMDFGLAFHYDSTMRNITGGVIGTLPYLAPEVLSEQPASIESDLYAIGVMAYELFVGEHPFESDDFTQFIIKIMTDKPSLYMLPTDIADIIGRLLAKAPEDRYTDALDVILAFADALEMDVSAMRLTHRDSLLQAARFVGRDAEMQQLRGYLNDILEGGTAFVLVGGESGVGKSRLIDQVRSRALTEGITVLRGQALADGGVPYQEWRDILRYLVLMTEPDDRIAAVLKEVVPDIATLLGRKIPNPPKITGEEHGRRLIQSIVDLFYVLDEPMMLIFEDLQWVTDGLLPLQHLLDARESLSELMIVATYRDDEMLDLPKKLPDADVISLTRLDDDAVKELSRAMLGENGTQPEIVSFLQKETEGNTFFMVEVARVLAEEAGGFDEIDTIHLSDHILTGGMRTVLEHRLNKIADQDRPLLRLAAVAGRQLDEDVLAHLDATDDIENWLNRCSDAAVIVLQDNRWQFAHDKLRESILNALDDDALQHAHREVAEAIEAAHPDTHDYDAILLNHWQAAGDFDKEIYYLGKLAAIRIIRGYYHEGIEQTKEILSRLPENDARRAILYIRIGSAYRQLGEYEPSRDFLQQAVDIAVLHDDQAVQSSALISLGNLANGQGDIDDAQAYYQRSLAIKEHVNDERGIALVLNNLALLARRKGNLEQAEQYFKRSVDIKETVGDRRGIAFTRNNLGLLAQDQGDFSEAATYFEQSLATFEEIRAQNGVAVTLTNLAWLHLQQEQLAQAQEKLMRAMAIAQQIAAVPLMLSHLVGLAHINFLRDSTTKTLDWVGLALHHPAKNNDVQENIDKLMPKLDDILSPDAVQSAFERGKSLDLDTLVAQVLAEQSIDED